MALWRAVLPAGVTIEVQYEDVIAELEHQTRGLPWDGRNERYDLHNGVCGEPVGGEVDGGALWMEHQASAAARVGLLAISASLHP